jgi:hypothetical protein
MMDDLQVDLLNEQNIEVINGSNTGPDGEPSQTNHDPLVLNFVAMFGPGYLSELAYTLMGVNAVITWSKLFKCLLWRRRFDVLRTIFSDGRWCTV